MKTCAKCKQLKQDDAFALARNGRLYPYCRPCKGAMGKDWRKRNRTRVLEDDRERAKRKDNRRSLHSKRRDFARNLQDLYGITCEDWARMFHTQGGCCASCQSPLVVSKHVHVDHCHDTKRVRGLLCHGCNVALGLLDDSPSRISALRRYIRGEAVETPAAWGL